MVVTMAICYDFCNLKRYILYKYIYVRELQNQNQYTLHAWLTHTNDKLAYATVI